VIGRQPWITVYSNTGRGIDIIFSLNIQQECIHSLIVVEKIFTCLVCTLPARKNYVLKKQVLRIANLNFKKLI
jgi:hypothetical protein